MEENDINVAIEDGFRKGFHYLSDFLCWALLAFCGFALLFTSSHISMGDGNIYLIMAVMSLLVTAVMLSIVIFAPYINVFTAGMTFILYFIIANSTLQNGWIIISQIVGFGLFLFLYFKYVKSLNALYIEHRSLEEKRDVTAAGWVVWLVKIIGTTAILLSIILLISHLMPDMGHANAIFAIPFGFGIYFFVSLFLAFFVKHHRFLAIVLFVMLHMIFLILYIISYGIIYFDITMLLVLPLMFIPTAPAAYFIIKRYGYATIDLKKAIKI